MALEHAVWLRKYSNTFLTMGCNYYFGLFDIRIISEIKKVNFSSINIFESVGFKRESSKEDFLVYSLESETILKSNFNGFSY